VTAAGSIPTGLPWHLSVGLGEQSGATWMKGSGVPWDIRYAYFTYGWANNWGYGSRNGSWGFNYLNESSSEGFIPAVDALQPQVNTVYNFLSPFGLTANATGATYDFLVGDPIDRDSDYYKMVENQNRWWDPSDTASVDGESFNRYASWLSLWNAKAGKRWILWQISMATRITSTLAIAVSRARDKRTTARNTFSAQRAHSTSRRGRRTASWDSCSAPARVARVATTAAEAFEGTHSLAATLAETSSGTASVSVSAPATPAGAAVTFHVFIPAGTTVTSVQPFALQGAAGNWTWTGDWQAVSSLKLGAWNTLTVTVPSSGDAALPAWGPDRHERRLEEHGVHRLDRVVSPRTRDGCRSAARRPIAHGEGPRYLTFPTSALARIPSGSAGCTLAGTGWGEEVMKGTITKCLSAWVTKKYGADLWREVLRDGNAGDQALLVTMAVSDIDDALALRLFVAAGRVLNLSDEAVADGFGEYWTCTYAPTLYRSTMRRFTNARELLLGLDHVHVEVTAMMTNARPPRFDYRWEGESVLIVTYKSARNLLPLYMGLVRGVGKHFNEPLDVRRVGDDLVRIEFLQAPRT
jgi:hypothetical protein